MIKSCFSLRFSHAPARVARAARRPARRGDGGTRRRAMRARARRVAAAATRALARERATTATRWGFDARRGRATRDGASDSTTAATRDAEAGRASGPRGARGRAFERDARDARDALRRWLRSRGERPRRVRGRDGAREPTFRAAYAPYWVFDVTAETSCAGSVEVGGSWVRSGTAAKTTRFDATTRASQICASFAHRRDFVDRLLPGACVSFDPNDFDAMDWARARAKAPEGTVVEPFEMRRSMALSLATARMRDVARAEASEELMKKHKGATSTRDICVEFTTLSRDVYAVYHPVWYVSFEHGYVVDENANKIIQQPREAVVCGVTGLVVSDDLICDHKARALAFSAVAIPASIAAYVWPESAYFFLGQGALASAVAAAGAAVLARQVPKMRQDKIDAVRVHDEERAFARAMRSVGNSEWMDESVQRRRDDAEWRRWRETDKMRWDPDKRRAWAYSILETQIFRFRERQEMRHEMEERAHLADEAARREAEMERKYGANWKRSRGDDAHGAPSGRHPGFSRDIHGFYKTLRLDAKLGHATEEEIKAAFRLVALETHPDKVAGDASAKKRAAERFQLAQKAYAVLGNKFERTAYDRK